LPTPEALTRELSRRVRELQSKARLPSVSAAVSRGGEVIWSEAVGLAQVDGGVEATPDTQYRVGSITKTFTAMAIMQLRDAGELALDDRLGDHIPEAAHPGPTIRRMLAHSSGLQREPTGDLWESMQAPSVEQLLSTLEEAEQVLEPGRWFHYSNLAFCLLGEVVSRRGGMPYRRFVQERILDPVGLSRTTWDPTEPVGHGYFVEPYMDGVRRELDDVDLEGAASAGQLWSTTEDLCRWGAFLSDPDPAVIAPASVDDMHTVQVMTDDGWHQAWGLGLALTREGERIVGGHSGGMPGFITCFAYSRKERVVATALTNGLFDMEPITHKLLAAVADAFPGEPETWKPGTKPPAAVADILGRWWSEGEEYIFSWRGDRLVGMPAYQPSDDDRAVFVSEGDDRFRVESGRERGEVLRVIRGADGVPEKLYWATYPFRREPFTFGELLRQ
jgi:CubicO group peptidase (beta-lactamase class C family)